MISVAEAQQRVLAGVVPLAPEIVALSAACGRVCAADLFARTDQPPADLSAMDGYALQGALAAGSLLRVVGQAPAGHPFAGRVAPDTCVRIFTGGVLPEGADSILIQEHARDMGEDRIALTQPSLPGQHIRRRGQDFAVGAPIVAAGTRLTPRHIGLCASANHPWLAVHRRPRVALIATGDEIALPGEPVPPGGIHGGNGPALAALATRAGAEATLLPAAADDRAALAVLIEATQRFDVLLTIGGASVGAHDLVQEALLAAGMTLDFWKIAMRPGKPLIHGRIGARSVLGVPGNPVAALLCGALFLRPLIAALEGTEAAALPVEIAELGMALKPNDQRLDFVRATLRGKVVTPLPRQDSAAQADFAAADALLLRAPFAPAAAAGARVEIVRMAAIGL